MWKIWNEVKQKSKQIKNQYFCQLSIKFALEVLLKCFCSSWNGCRLEMEVSAVTLRF